MPSSLNVSPPRRTLQNPITPPPLAATLVRQLGIAAAIAAALTAASWFGWSLTALDTALLFCALAAMLFTVLSFTKLFTQLRVNQRRSDLLGAELIKLHLELSDLEEAQAVAKYGSWRMDLEGNNIEPSAEYLNIMGMDATEFPRDRESWLKRFIEPERRELARLSLERGRTGESFEITRLFDLGVQGQKWLRTKIIPVLDSSGRVESFRGVMHDLTAEKNAQEQ